MGQPRESRLDRVGIPYALRWGFVGVLVFMVGHGVEASLVAPHIAAGLRNTAVIPTIVAAYGVSRWAVARWRRRRLVGGWGDAVPAAGRGGWVVA